MEGFSLDGRPTSMTADDRLVCEVPNRVARGVLAVAGAPWSPKVLVDHQGLTLFGLFGEDKVSWRDCGAFEAVHRRFGHRAVRYRHRGRWRVAPRLAGMTVDDQVEFLEGWRTSELAG